MRHHRSVLPQDPSLSPTYALSQQPSSPPAVVPQPLRRNLFATHLSRRPGLSQELPRPIPNASTDRIMDPFNDGERPLTMPSPTRPQTQPHIYRSESSTHEQARTQQPSIESRRSRSRSVSPVKTQPTQQATGIGNIIALDPDSGRPDIPALPHLPRHLRIKDEDTSDEQPDGYHPTEEWELPRLNQSDLQRHSSSLIANDSQRQRLHELIDSTHAGDYRDYERIERVLSEMQSQQRARARLVESIIDTPVTSSISTRTRGKARAATKSYDTTQSVHGNQHRLSRPGGGGGGGGVGATIDPVEKEELLSLIMSSLAKKVQVAQRDDWMFGKHSHAGNDFDSFHGQLEA